MTDPATRPTQVLFRSKEGVELYTLPDTSSSGASAPATPPPAKQGGVALYRGKTTFHVLHPRGACAYVHDASVGVVRCPLDGAGAGDRDGGVAPFLPGSRAVQMAKCSPRGSRLLTWERPRPGADGGDGNLKVWDATQGE